MKIMRRDSWPGTSRPGSRDAKIQPSIQTPGRLGDRNPQEFTMTQWIKPQATDLRYGFEITMYISAR
jgi:coenzyme PQQ precursor peptide PqqA